MSIKQMSPVLDYVGPITPSEKLLLLTLADRADDFGGQLWPSIPYLAKRALVSERQAKRIMKKFKEYGLIEVVKSEKGGRNKTPHYQLHIERLTTYGIKGDTVSPFTESERVTSEALKGDIGDTKRVTPMTPNPLYDSSLSLGVKGKSVDNFKGQQVVVSEEEAERNFKNDPTRTYCPAHYRGDILPFNWCSKAEELGIENEEIYKAWRRFKDTTSWPMSFYKWQRWCEGLVRRHSSNQDEREVRFANG